MITRRMKKIILSAAVLALISQTQAVPLGYPGYEPGRPDPRPEFQPSGDVVWKVSLYSDKGCRNLVATHWSRERPSPPWYVFDDLDGNRINPERGLWVCADWWDASAAERSGYGANPAALTVTLSPSDRREIQALPGASWKPYGDGAGASGSYNRPAISSDGKQGRGWIENFLAWLGSFFAPAPPTAPAPAGEGYFVPLEPEKEVTHSGPTFQECFAYTMKNEGGFCIDTGGPTYRGVTLATARAHGHSDPRQADAEAIFREYYNAIDADNLPADIRIQAADFAYWKGVSACKSILSTSRGRDETLNAFKEYIRQKVSAAKYAKFRKGMTLRAERYFTTP